jgi:hypothetical protein
MPGVLDKQVIYKSRLKTQSEVSETVLQTQIAASAGRRVLIDGDKFSIDIQIEGKGGDELGSVVKKRRKKMRKHKHRKLLAKTRHQRRKGK